jgi:Leucine-rich repeat (LRR) protein
MFNSYTNNKLPNGEKSTIYVIVNNGLFEGKTDECYQIHFESKQIKSRQNSSNVNIYEPILSTSDGISEFFKEELTKLVKMSKDKSKNIYLDYLVSFGFTEALFDMLDERQPVIKFEGNNSSRDENKFQIPKLPDISRFKNIDELMLLEVSLVTLHPSIGSLINLELLSLPGNKIKELPKEIGYLKNLEFMNIKGNPITVIPDEIKFLDKTNGGSLYRISINESDCGKENYLKLKKLLPTTIISGD